MSTELLTTTVHSATVGVIGRSINQARDQHLVIGSPSIGSALAAIGAIVCRAQYYILHRRARFTAVRSPDPRTRQPR